MKKLLSLLTASLLLLSSFSLTVFADEAVTGQTDAPDWIITEIANDCQGKAENTPTATTIPYPPTALSSLRSTTIPARSWISTITR